MTSTEAVATSAATAAGQLDFTTHWIGLAALAIFALAYLLVIAEEAIHLRKSKPVVVAAGLIWTLLAAVYTRVGLSDRLEPALGHVFSVYAELLLVFLFNITYVNALS